MVELMGVIEEIGKLSPMIRENNREYTNDDWADHINQSNGVATKLNADSDKEIKWTLFHTSHILIVFSSRVNTKHYFHGTVQ